MGFKDKIMAVHVLQRFVRMSRVLIPLFFELKAKGSLSSNEQIKVRGIEDVYDNFKADPITSKELINSNVLELIQQAYKNCKKSRGLSPEGFYKFEQFLRESDRLISLWDKQLLN